MLTIISTALLLFLTSAVVSGCSAGGPDRPETVAGPLVVRYFYMNVCSSCDEEGDFYKRFEKLTGVSRNTPNMIISAHNVYERNEMAFFERTAAEIGYDTAGRSFPVLIIDGRVISSGINDELQSGAVSEALPQPETTLAPGDSVAVYFGAPGCADCEKAEKFLGSLKKSYDILNEISALHIIRASVADAQGLSLFREYCDAYKIPENKQKVPVLFIGYNALLGPDDIGRAEDILAAGGGRDTLILYGPGPGGGGSASVSNGVDDTGAAGGRGSLDGAGVASGGGSLDAAGTIGEDNMGVVGGGGSASAGGYGVVGALLAGMVNGLNPCSVSMLFMLLSLLALKEKWILPAGFAFLFGKFICFLLLGTLLYGSLGAIDFNALRSAASIIMTAFAVIMIILNVNDLIAAKNQEYNKIKLQLPRGLRSLNHKIIKIAAGARSGFALIAGSAALGAAISAGEFLCTGQIYVAVILSALNSGSGPLAGGAALRLLALYSAAFVAPPALIVILMSAGKKIFALSEFFRKKLVYIKMFNIIVFLCLIISVIFL